MAMVIDLDDDSLSSAAPASADEVEQVEHDDDVKEVPSPPLSAASSSHGKATTTTTSPARSSRGRPPAETPAAVIPIDVDEDDDEEDAADIERLAGGGDLAEEGSPGRSREDGEENSSSSEDAGRESEDEDSKIRVEEPAEPADDADSDADGKIGSGSSGSATANPAENGKEDTKPASSASGAAKAATASSKPKSTRKRSPSPSPPPQVPRPPVKTIRLDIRLGGPENYAVDVTALAKSSGQLPASPPPPPALALPDGQDVSESEANDDTDAGKVKKKGKGGRKKNLQSEEYDLTDPFIDDSELAIDERKTFAQTKQQGFYVSSGEVALVKDKTSPQKKPKSKKIIPTIIPLAGSSTLNVASKSHGPNSAVTSSNDPFGGPSSNAGAPPSSSGVVREGSKDAPIPIDDGPPPSVNGLKRKASGDSPTISIGGSAANGSKKKRKTVDIESFHPELQETLHELKAAIAKESFEQKGKFPPGLKPMLNRVALKAIGCGEYNENFFNLMPQLFIYNKFTMTKLIKRTVYNDHQALLAARQDELLGQLKKIADDDYPRAVEEYEKHISQWEKRQAKAAEGGANSVETTPAPPGSASATPNVNNTVPLPATTGGGGDESGMEVDGAPPSTQGAAGGGQHNAHTTRPSKRYRLTEPMRNIIWELVVLSNESVRIENEKNTLEQANVQTVSEQGMRKTLYQRIVQAYPEGWMSSGQISREVSVMKKRFEQQQQEEAS